MGGVEESGIEAEGLELERLWTPYRMDYIATRAAKPEGCPFCAMSTPAEGDLVIARGELAFAVLNLHPYNPGHLMVIPYRHVGDLTDLTPAEAAEVTEMTTHAVRTIRSVSHPHGFNIGLNLGKAAGGSVSEHLHQHVVPRWTGDASFITITGGAKVLPQLLEDTQALLTRAW